MWACVSLSGIRFTWFGSGVVALGAFGSEFTPARRGLCCVA